MHDLKTGHQSDVFQILEPLPVFFGQLLAGPLNRLSRVWIESFQIGFTGTILVVVALDARHPRVPNQVETFLRIGVITDHVPEAHVVCADLLFGVFQNHSQRLEIGVNIGDDGVFHFKTTSSHYFKPAKVTGGFAPARLFVANEAAYFGVLDRPVERFQFFFRSLSQQFHPSIQ